jgi:hypothetical protein
MFLETILKRVDDNEEIFKRILDDEAFRTLIKEWYAKRVFDALNKITTTHPQKSKSDGR